MSKTPVVRPETLEDYAAIDALVEAAFGQPNEAQLVRLIRASEGYVPELAFVAEEDGRVVGHIMLSYVTLSGPEERQVLLLAPLAVLPERQRDGIGGALVQATLERAEEREEPLVVVAGHPAYYPRFGFELASRHGITPPSAEVPDEAFMVRPLSNYDETYRGQVRYPPAFDVA